MTPEEKPFEEIAINIGLRGRKQFPLLNKERKTNYEIYELEDKELGEGLVVEKYLSEELGIWTYTIHIVKDRDELGLRFPELMKQAEEDFMNVIDSFFANCDKDCKTCKRRDENVESGKS